MFYKNGNVSYKLGIGRADLGYNSYQQQEKINKNICNLQDKMAAYIEESNKEYTVYTGDYNIQKKKLKSLNDQISALNEDTKIAHDSFKKNYTFFLIGGISLLVILVFIFASKKLILHETAMKN